MHLSPSPTPRKFLGTIVFGLLVLLMLSMFSDSVFAASSWSPTLLVNTESFQTIDSGDGTTDIELRFGSSTQTLKYLTTGKFQFSKSLSVVGGISGSYLTIDHQANISGSLTVKGATTVKGTLSGENLIVSGVTSLSGAVTAKGNITAKGTLSGENLIVSGVSSFTGAATFKNSVTVKGAISGASLRVSGPAEIYGTLTTTGSIRTEGNLTINDDADTNDAVLTFGNNTANQTLKFLNTQQIFEFSKGIRVLGTISGSALRVDGNATIGGPLTVTGSVRTKGNLSGSTLTVDGNLTLHGVTYSAPSAQGGINTFLKNDGNGNLTWSAAASVGNGSGGILSLHPEYPNAIYFSSGATNIGQLTMSGGTTDLENSYQWTSTRSALQDYWISVRERLPDNFSSWDPIKALEFRFKTGVAGGGNNHLTLRVRDTAGALQNFTGGLVGTSWTTATLPAFSGTWTPKGYFTIYVKLAAKSTASAAANAGFINLNYETTTP